MHQAKFLGGMWILLVLLSYHVTSVTSQNDNQRVCQTEDCRLSQQIASMMDTSVDPCEDMFQFSCGGWLRDNPLPVNGEYLTLRDKLKTQNEKEIIQFLEDDDVRDQCRESTALEKARTIFKTCSQTEANATLLYQSLVNYIDELGSWTVTPTPRGWNEANWSLQHALEKSHSLWGFSFWNYYINFDYRNFSRTILYVRQNGLHDDVYPHLNRNPFDVPAFKEAFMNETVPLALLLGGEEQTAREKLEVVYEFQKKLSKIFLPLDLKDKGTNLTFEKRMTVGEFQTVLGSWIDVDKYFSTVAGQKFVTKDDEMIVDHLDYFKRLRYIIQGTDKEVLANYIVYNFVKLARSYFPSFMPIKANTGLEKCLELFIMNDLMYPSASLFVEKHLSPELHTMAALIINGLEHQFVKTFEDSDWIDSKVIQRLKSMKISIGGEDWITDLVTIDKRYETLEAVAGDYLQNRANIVRFKSNMKARRYRSPAEIIHFRQVYDVSSEYNSAFNELFVPTGILMEPLASASYPDAYLYGSIGTHIGTDLINNLDREKNSIYANSSECWKDQIDTYQLHGENLTGQLQIDQFIADNVGLKLSYGAYKNAFKLKHSLPNMNLTEDQLFFVGMSQYFCGHYAPEYELERMKVWHQTPDKLRVFHVIANSPEFALAFKCSERSTLNPEEKCSVW
ncbi:endothelin-converting enzyme 2 [Biomphalaria pfeifferi]|uniref:Endothelin-converting enzyme 2 n=1 Tax=Biomphalaria pfeifferi TaxID=112525 RepID=A0AAD8BLW1_BIOPF|nr:endothelin-converting enzyme 2 [Biomphalaria pfeifferi]